jgi:hypothetical protein
MARKDKIKDWQHDWNSAWSKIQQAAALGVEADPNLVKNEILPLLQDTIEQIEKLVLLYNRDA